VPCGGDLLEALVIGIVEEADGGGALGDARRLVIGRPGDGAAKARGLVAVGVVGEARGDGAAGDTGHRMRLRRACGRIGIGADVGFGSEIADRIVGEALGCVAIGVDRGRGQPVEDV
jgi:hypothetical protein